MVTADYSIVIDGELTDDLRGEFEPLVVIADGGRTTLRGRDFDQAALHGLLARIAALGLTLLSVVADSKSA